jgi:superfamily I DNA and RNA helicase
MGASRVEAVTEVKFASKDLPVYDYVIVKEATDFPEDLQDDVTFVHVPWVKDCLISGRLLTLPSR